MLSAKFNILSHNSVPSGQILILSFHLFHLVYLYSAFRILLDFQMSLYNFHFPVQATFFIFHFSWGVHPLPDQLPGEHTGLPSHVRQYLFFIWPFNAAVIYTLTHGR